MKNVRIIFFSSSQNTGTKVRSLTSMKWSSSPDAESWAACNVLKHLKPSDGLMVELHVLKSSQLITTLSFSCWSFTLRHVTAPSLNNKTNRGELFNQLSFLKRTLHCRRWLNHKLRLHPTRMSPLWSWCLLGENKIWRTCCFVWVFKLQYCKQSANIPGITE